MDTNTPGRHMRREILEQPKTIEATLAAETDEIVKFADHLRKRGTKHVLIVARGTSDNAAMYARYAFGVVAQKLTTLAAPSLLTLYDVELDLGDSLVLGISQSGESPEVLEYLSHARQKGVLTCALTNTSDAPIEDAADFVLCTHARKETSVAATKTYTTALAALHQLATLWAGDMERARQIYQVPGWIEEVLKTEGHIEAKAERFRYMEACAVMSRGFNLCTALETALKLAECCYVAPTPYSGADFMHGPVASIEPGFPCFVFAPEGKAMQSMSELMDALDEREAETIVVSNSGRMLDRGTLSFEIPAIPEELTPMVAVVVGQLLALHLAIEKGIDPDKPRGLNKITLTL